MRLGDNGLGYFRRQALRGAGFPQGQPALEHIRRYLRPVAYMGRHGLALVTARGEHHRRPEIRQLAQMLRLVGNRPVEDRTEQRVGAHLGVEMGDKPGEARFVETVSNVHDIRL